MQSMFSLTDRRAVVTGASRGIGRAIAVSLAANGAHVLAVARSRDALEETAAQAAGLEGAISTHVADLQSPDDIESTMEHAVDTLGGIDVLVNNAAGDHFSRIEETDLATYQRVLDLNLQSCWLACRAASPALRASDGGSVVNVASILGTIGSAGESAYIAAKHGLIGLTRALAVEWGGVGVRVNALAPGYVETAMTAEALATEKFGEHIRRRTPLQRWAQPEEMAGAVIFMASSASSFMTGQTIIVDGGWTAQ